NPAYPLMAPATQEPSDSAEQRVSLRDKEVRLEHLQAELKEKAARLTLLTEKYHRLRKVYRNWREEAEALEAEKQSLQEALAHFEKKAGELLNPAVQSELKSLLGDVLKDVGIKVLGHVMSGQGQGLGQPAPAFRPPVQAIARQLQHWTDEQLHYLHHMLASVSAQPELWAALRQLIPPPEANTSSQEPPAQKSKPKVSFEPME
ncbi:MAG: hypothetical protein KF690_11185, partial [Bacteroidetes bacterium]|nr:hypothetical protein [Bacteroidota bacterium]